MSKPGDVVWADGRAWLRDDYWSQLGTKNYWIASDADADARSTKHLKAFKDFRWLVKNGQQWGEYIPADQATIYRVGVTDGEALERAAIMKWLRGGGQKLIANAIERGAHLAGDDE